MFSKSAMLISIVRTINKEKMDRVLLKSFYIYDSHFSVTQDWMICSADEGERMFTFSSSIDNCNHVVRELVRMLPISCIYWISIAGCQRQRVSIRRHSFGNLIDSNDLYIIAMTRTERRCRQPYLGPI